MTSIEQKSYDLGCAHAHYAASWVLDGNHTQEHYVNLLAMLDAGDPQADEYLPARPNLSGEWADDPTPRSLAREIVGRRLCSAGPDAELLDALADAYERGVDDTFMIECERLPALRGRVMTAFARAAFFRAPNPNDPADAAIRQHLALAAIRRGLANDPEPSEAEAQAAAEFLN